MGYLFYNNWPYSYSTFPSMDDGIDPVNHEYFSGLHIEIENIENVLGLNVESGFDTVKQKIENHNHSGGDNGVVLPSLKSGLNLLDNFSFEIWQRGTSQRPDRWVLAQSLSYWPVSRETTRVKNGSYSLKLTKSTAADGQFTLLKQGLENSSIYYGQTIHASIYVYLDNDYDEATMRLYMTDDTGDHLLDSTSEKNSWVRLSGFYVPTSTTKLGIKLEITTDTGSGTYCYVYVDFATMSVGDFDTDIITSYFDDLMRCFRWYWKTERFVRWIYGATGQSYIDWYPYPVPMATNPTVTVSGGLSVNCTNVGIDSNKSNNLGFAFSWDGTASARQSWHCDATNTGYISAEATEPTI